MALMAFENGKSLTKEEIIDNFGHDHNKAPAIKSIFDMSEEELNSISESDCMKIVKIDNDITFISNSHGDNSVHDFSLWENKVKWKKTAFEWKNLKKLIDHQIKYLEQMEINKELSEES